MVFQMMGLMGSMMWVWFVPLMIWSAIWKGIGLWKSAQARNVVWFVLLFVLNTAGILPIIYIFFVHQDRDAGKTAAGSSNKQNKHKKRAVKQRTVKQRAVKRKSV